MQPYQSCILQEREQQFGGLNEGREHSSPHCLNGYAWTTATFCWCKSEKSKGDGRGKGLGCYWDPPLNSPFHRSPTPSQKLPHSAHLTPAAGLLLLPEIAGKWAYCTCCHLQQRIQNGHWQHAVCATMWPFATVELLSNPG